MSRPVAPCLDPILKLSQIEPHYISPDDPCQVVLTDQTFDISRSQFNLIAPGFAQARLSQRHSIDLRLCLLWQFPKQLVTTHHRLLRITTTRHQLYSSETHERITPSEVRAKRASKDAARSRRRDPLRRSPRLSCASLRKVLNRTPVALHKRFLLGAAPTLQPAFRRDRVGDPIEMLGPDELHRPARRGVSAVVSGIVHGYALRKVVSCRRADVVRPVSA